VAIVGMGCTVLFTLCSRDSDSLSDWLEEGEEFSGGGASINDDTENAFGNPAPNLTGMKDLFFATGNSMFRVNWVTAPASTEDLDGLGPVFNARSCSACHFKDGRAAPPMPGEDPLGLLFRLSRLDEITWEPIPDENYGGQFNTRAILGMAEEGKVEVTYTEMPGTYPDGTPYLLRRPNYQFTNLQYGPLHSSILFSPRIGPQILGLGLLEAIAEEDMLAIASQQASEDLGISGKANYVTNVLTGETQVGKFGWKSNQPTVRQQVASAFRGDIGITSSMFPEQPCAPGQEDCANAINGGEPELTDKVLDRVTLYSAAIAVPMRRDWAEPVVLQGKALFNTIGCASCHTPKFVTKSNPEFPEFEDQTIFPYTDLLLHDMGEGLADGRPDGLADGNEWRTPPLWGIGLIDVVNDHNFLLHDGRARGFEEAILWHGGEAEVVTNNFKSLEASEREAIIKFLESL
ncbi:MAG: di-heme oxidoredictase family protein, partial [Bacteroidota bacterium]